MDYFKNNNELILQTSFIDNLHYLYVIELRKIAEQLIINTSGKKAQLISKIVAYISRGEKLDLVKYPDKSLANGKKPKICVDSLMLKGAYKNDLNTREFFKKLIGGHFHFTVFGLDWIEKQWIEGNPPTYGQFVEMWQREYELQKKFPAPAKAEWKYILFVQDYLSKNKNASRAEILEAWNKARLKALEEVRQFLKLKKVMPTS